MFNMWPYFVKLLADHHLFSNIIYWVKIPFPAGLLPAVDFFFLICCFRSGSFPGGSFSKESTCNVGDLGLIPGLGRSPGEGTRYPLQSSGLENSMDCIVHGVAKRQTRLSRFHFTRRDKESICQCRRRGFDPWVREIPWRRKWQPVSVFLSGESHRQRSLVGCNPWNCKEPATT